MGGREGTGIPAIDLQGFPSQHEKLRGAGEEWGCFRVFNHGIPEALMGEMKAVASSLLDLPTEAKKKSEDRVMEGTGYVQPSKANPLYEALGFYDMGSAGAVDMFCSKLNASPHQRGIIETYCKAMHELAMDMADKLSRSMGLSGGVFEDWACQLWMNRYSFVPESVGSIGVGLHTDAGFLAILQDDDAVGGLEVMDESGSFVPIDPWPGTFLVILGDMAAVYAFFINRDIARIVLIVSTSPTVTDTVHSDWNPLSF
ncbi:2-oxoglutarate-dependent dioxygenase DAO-like isoform X2 [Rhodamnia argentea]|uniref:2-oxoglutarate-dependent dioxygenase DAO-like isoform X2 n=1 Tax=Rhodamnia argentea TaxID=178133 RepID=A0ABM3HU05_9MYRT|nr:2-oxoglutarate-dependent dioxygenase DAO-like isoform X2 [Rhodamnia argentea]